MAGKRNNTLLKAAALTTAFSAGYLYYENNRIEVNYYALHSDRGSGVRLLQLSDLHDKVLGNGNKRLLDKIKKIKPDIILLTGDTVSTGGKNLKATCAFLRRLTASYLVVGILGNHEQRGDAQDRIESAMLGAGVDLLKNENKVYDIRGTKVSVLGLCEKQALKRSDYIKAFFNLLSYENHDEELLKLEESCGIRLLLSHFPENYALTGPSAYNRYSFELMLSGHAHGGQIRLPVLGGIYAPGQGFFPKYCKGIYPNRKNALLVSGGIGNDGPCPRVNNPPSLAVVDFI